MNALMRKLVAGAHLIRQALHRKLNDDVPLFRLHNPLAEYRRRTVLGNQFLDSVEWVHNVKRPNDSAHRWRPLGASRIATRRRGAAIRWSAWLGRLVVVRFGAGPALQKRTQRIRLLAQFRTFDVPN